MDKYDDPLTAGRRAAARAILREAELELQLLKKLSEAAEQLDRLARQRAEAALEFAGDDPEADQRPGLSALPGRAVKWER